MLVHVLVRDVGHHSDVELAGIHSMLGPAMGCRLQHNVSQTRFHHFCEITLDVMRIRCGDVESGIQHFIPNDSIDGGDHPRFDARRNENFMDKVAGGGLAVGAGHADDGQLAGGESMKRRRQPGERMTRLF